MLLEDVIITLLYFIAKIKKKVLEKNCEVGKFMKFLKKTDTFEKILKTICNISLLLFTSIDFVLSLILLTKNSKYEAFLKLSTLKCLYFFKNW